MADDDRDNDPPTPDELRACAKVLAKLRADPMAFRLRATDPGGHLREIRAGANRLIAALQADAHEARGANRPKRSPDPGRPAAGSPTPERKCYMCHRPLAPRDGGRRGFCRGCETLNDGKRRQVPSVDGMRALVTGGRVGIGFATALRLLRGGASVDVVTRFPYDAASRFWREDDSRRWRDRLRIHGLDLRDLTAVERFGQFLAASGPPEIVINNAAQTVRRPASYYRRTADFEGPGGDPIREASARLVCDYSAHLDRPDAERVRAIVAREDFRPPARPAGGAITRLVRRMIGAAEPTKFHSPAMTSALLATTPLLPGDLDAGQWLVADPATGESIDLRPSNTWTQTIDEIDAGELIEVHCANALAPYLLLKSLLPAMERSRFPKRFVVNLAAAEGSFQLGHGRGTHPHTNMAKASLNMLTRTLGKWLAERHIYINSVDPGWVSDQRPYHIARQAVEEDRLRDLLTAEDAAARVTDPIATGIASPTPPWGRLFRNFDVADW